MWRHHDRDLATTTLRHFRHATAWWFSHFLLGDSLKSCVLLLSFCSALQDFSWVAWVWMAVKIFLPGWNGCSSFLSALSEVKRYRHKLAHFLFAYYRLVHVMCSTSPSWLLGRNWHISTLDIHIKILWHLNYLSVALNFRKKQFSASTTHDWLG